jgi:hypothetical protein
MKAAVEQRMSTDMISELERIHRLLMAEDDRYRRCLLVVPDEYTGEGSWPMDDFVAADTIRGKAKALVSYPLLEIQLATIIDLLDDLLERQGIDRSARRVKRERANAESQKERLARADYIPPRRLS